MPATASRPATSRQISYINSLRAEREMNPLSVETINDLTTAAASIMIDALLQTPRRASPVTPVVGPSGDLFGPSPTVRAGRMLLGGQVTATITLTDGTHVTLTARCRKVINGRWKTVPFETPGMTLYVEQTYNHRTLARLRRTEDHHGLAYSFVTRGSNGATAADALLNHAAGERVGLIVQVADRCGCCGRALTDPISIERGIGPDCYGRMTGSQHANVDAPVNGDRRPTALAPVEASPEHPTSAVASARCANNEGLTLMDLARSLEPATAALIEVPAGGFEDEADMAEAVAEAERKAREQAPVAPVPPSADDRIRVALANDAEALARFETILAHATA